MAELTPQEAQSLSKFLGNITDHTELEALALVTREGLRLAFSCIPDYEIDPDLFAECQALLLNYDKILEKEFGLDFCIRESLSFSL